MTEVYYRNDVWRYMTRQGEMDCPPFVQTVGDVHSYLRGVPHEIVGEIPKRGASAAEPRWVNYTRRRSLDGELLEDEPQSEARQREARRREVKIREHKARRERKPRGKGSVLPIYHAYDREGNLVAGFRTLYEAADYAHRSRRAIMEVMDRGDRTSGGFRWRRTDDAPQRIEPCGDGSRNLVCSSYDKNGYLVATYESVKQAAAAVGRQAASISGAMHKPESTIAGYRWRAGSIAKIEPL